MRRLLCLLAVLVAQFALSHPADVPSALAKVQAGGAVELRIKFDILSFILDGPPQEIADNAKLSLLSEDREELQARLDEAKGRLSSGFSGLASPSIAFPTADEVLSAAQSMGPRPLPLMLPVTVTGQAASSLSLRFPQTLGTVILTVEMPYQEPYSEPVEPGAFSTPLPIPTAVEVKKAAATMQPSPAPPTKPEPVKAAPSVKAPVLNKDDLALAILPAPKQAPIKKPLPKQEPKAATPVASVAAPVQLPSTPTPPRPAWYVLMGRYVGMGFRHIVPEGLDHILFVLGLFLLSRKTKDLLTQISCFTLAHSLTLGLSLYGVVRLPSSVVEPLIAASIVFVAVENLCTTEMKAWRPSVVFGFGLVHGLGFAGALQDAGLAKANFLTALLGFNAGVELGQLSVVAVAFLLVGWFRSNPRYRPTIAIPASVAIAVVAMVWTLERLGV